MPPARTFLTCPTTCSPSIGLKGLYVEREQDVADAWEQALASEVPVVIDFRTDPDVPPLPPHITLEQAKKFAGALLQGDPTKPASCAKPRAS